MNEVAEYIERNRRAGGLYISLNEETNKELEGICEKVVNIEFVQEDRSFNSTKNIEYA